MEAAMILTKNERMELTKQASSRSVRAEDARRARCVLLLADGDTWAEVRSKLACNDEFIARWSTRFKAERLAGLYSRHRGQPARTLTPKLEARILETTRRGPT